MYHYFPFTTIGDFTGVYSTYSSTSFNIPMGNICQPSDSLKFNAGTSSWIQTPDTYTFLNSELDITSLNGTDWSTSLKNEWFESYLIQVCVNDYLVPSEKALILTYLESIDLFQTLSSPSILYVTRNDGTNGLIIDPLLINNEVSIGMNVYKSDYIIDFAKTLPNNNGLKNKIYSYHKKGNIYISNVCKVNYNGYEDYVWCFDGLVYNNYDIANIGIVPSLTNGGGNIFGEVKLAANYIQAHYIVKKNVNNLDPTFGLCSGGGKPFCTGDELVIVDTSSYTTNGTSGWSWIGDYSTIPITIHIADVSNPCVDYSNVGIGSMFFPFRIIQFCLFNDFG